MPNPNRKFLTPIERNLLRYIIQFKDRNPDEPCYIPQHINSQTKDYLRAIHYLEDKEYIAVTKTSNHYRTWVVELKKVPDPYGSGSKELIFN